MGNNKRYHHFWIYITVVEEDDDRGAKIMKLGYKVYRDYGNECYGDYLRHTATKVYKARLITYLEHFSITKYNDANSGNILGAIMGY
eukprot:10425481-Heterocapsa_arctica.AAC.1